MEEYVTLISGKNKTERMKAMKKFTLTVFVSWQAASFFLSGIWIYFQKSLDRVELGEGEHAASYQRHYLMISNDKRYWYVAIGL